ncbi:MAG: rod-binding protein [Silicimonas sp.]|nr:rod-binding protein [Silicimonas sp.]
MDISGSSSMPLRPPEQAPRDPKLMQAARDLEANFLTEMLKNAGVGKARDSFGGGAGEDQFSSFLTREYANGMVEAGGIGLAESLYNALVKASEASK